MTKVSVVPAEHGDAAHVYDVARKRLPAGCSALRPSGLSGHLSTGGARIVREVEYESFALTISESNLPGRDTLLRRDGLHASFPLWDVRPRLLRAARSTLT